MYSWSISYNPFFAPSAYLQDREDLNIVDCMKGHATTVEMKSFDMQLIDRINNWFPSKFHVKSSFLFSFSFIFIDPSNSKFHPILAYY